MANELPKREGLERFAGFAERLNYVLGMVSLTGSVVFESTVLATIGVLQFAEGAVWKWLKDRRAKNTSRLIFARSAAWRLTLISI